MSVVPDYSHWLQPTDNLFFKTWINQHQLLVHETDVDLHDPDSRAASRAELNSELWDNDPQPSTLDWTQTGC